MNSQEDGNQAQEQPYNSLYRLTLGKNIENETANLTRNADLAIDFLKEDTNLPKEGSFSTTL